MKRLSAESEKSERRAFSPSAARSITTNSGGGSGTPRQRMDGRNARMSTGGIGVAPSKSTPPSRSSSPTISPATKPTATTAGPTPERDMQQRYPSRLTPTKMVGFDFDVDVVQWQSSQTTNPALINLLQEASSEESVLHFDSSSSRISPSWQHPPAKSPMSVTTPTAKSSSSAIKYSNLGSVSFSDMVIDSHSTSGQMRIRPSTSNVAFTPPNPHLQRNVKSTENGGNAPGSSTLFSSSGPNQILEMMRGVSAKINENMAVNTPDAKSKGKENATRVASTRTRRMGRSLSSMDIDVSTCNNMGKGKAHERDAVKNERSVSMMAINETDDISADADVSMAYAGAVVDIPNSPEILHSSVEVSRQRVMLPPPIPANTVKPTPRVGTNSSSTSIQQIHVADKARSAMVLASASTLTTDAPVDVSGESKPKEPPIQLHPLLREKEHRRRSQTSPPLSGSDSGNRRHSPTHSNLSTKTPLTRSMSASVTPTASQSVRPDPSFSLPPNASQFSRQTPPRLGMCRSRTAPSPMTDDDTQSLGVSPSLTTTNAKLVTNQGYPSKLLAKPFKPPSRKTPGPDHGSQQNAAYISQHGYSQRNTAYASQSCAMGSSSSSRAAYPSPSPNSDNDGKKGKESKLNLIAEEEGRPRSPPPLPPTPESVLNGGSGSEGQEDIRPGRRRDLDEEMEGADPDSSYGHMTLDIDIEALEETMRMFD